MKLVQIFLMLTSCCTIFLATNAQSDSNITSPTPELHYIDLNIRYDGSIRDILRMEIRDILGEYGEHLVRCYLNISESDVQTDVTQTSDIIAVEIRTLNISIFLNNFTAHDPSAPPSMIGFPFYLRHNGTLVPSVHAISVFESNCDPENWEDMYSARLGISATATFSSFAEMSTIIQSTSTISSIRSSTVPSIISSTRSSTVPSIISSIIPSIIPSTISSIISSIIPSTISSIRTSSLYSIPVTSLLSSSYTAAVSSFSSSLQSDTILSTVVPSSQVSAPVTTSLLQGTSSPGLFATLSVETTSIHPTMSSSPSLPIQTSLSSQDLLSTQTLQPPIGAISSSSSIRLTSSNLLPTPKIITPTPSLPSGSTANSTSALGSTLLPFLTSSSVPRLSSFSSNIQPTPSAPSPPDLPPIPAGMRPFQYLASATTPRIAQSSSLPFSVQTTMDSIVMSPSIRTDSLTSTSLTPTPMTPSPLPSLHYLVLVIRYQVLVTSEDISPPNVDINISDIITAIAARYLNLSTTPDVNVTSENGALTSRVDSVTITGISNTSNISPGIMERTITFYVIENATLIPATEVKEILDRSSNGDWTASIEVPNNFQLLVMDVTIRLYMSSLLPTTSFQTMSSTFSVLTTRSIAPTTIIPTQSLISDNFSTVSMVQSRLQSVTPTLLPVSVSQPSLPTLPLSSLTVSSRVIPVISTVITSTQTLAFSQSTLVLPGFLVSTTQTIGTSIISQPLRHPQFASSSVLGTSSSFVTQTIFPTPSLSRQPTSISTTVLARPTQTSVPVESPSSTSVVRTTILMEIPSAFVTTTQTTSLGSSVLQITTPMPSSSPSSTSVFDSTIRTPTPSSTSQTILPIPNPSSTSQTILPIPNPSSTSQTILPIPSPSSTSQTILPIPNPSSTSQTILPIPNPSSTSQTILPIPSPSSTSQTILPIPNPSSTSQTILPIPNPSSTSQTILPIPSPSSTSQTILPIPSPSSTSQTILPIPSPSSTSQTILPIPSPSSTSQTILPIPNTSSTSQTVLPMTSPSSTSVLQTATPMLSPSSSFVPLTTILISTPSSSFIPQSSLSSLQLTFSTATTMMSSLGIPPSNISTSFPSSLSSQVLFMSTSISSLLNQTVSTHQLVSTTQEIFIPSISTPLASIPTTSSISPTLISGPDYRSILDFDPGVGYLLLLTMSASKQSVDALSTLNTLNTELQLINLYSMALSKGVGTSANNRRKRDVFNTTSMLAAGIIESRSQVVSNPLEIVFYISQGEPSAPHRFIRANDSLGIYDRLEAQEYNSILVNYSFISIEIYSERFLFQPMTAVIVGSVLGCCILLLLVFLISISIYYCLHSTGIRSDKWSPEKALAFTNQAGSSEFSLQLAYEKEWSTEGTQTLARDFLTHETTDFIYGGEELKAEAMLFSPFQTEDSLAPVRKEVVTPSGEEGIDGETYLYQSQVDATMTRQGGTISQLRSDVEGERRRADKAETALFQIMASNRRQAVPVKGDLFSDPDEVRKAEERASTVYEKSKREMLAATERPLSAGQEASRYRRPRSAKVTPSTEPPEDSTAFRVVPPPKILDWDTDTVSQTPVHLTGFRSVKEPSFIPVKPRTLPPVIKHLPSHKSTPDSEVPLQSIPVRIFRSDGREPFQAQTSPLYTPNGNAVPVTTIKVLPSFNPFYTSAQKDHTQ